jgi:8-oxo-dGTP diphosphatase
MSMAGGSSIAAGVSARRQVVVDVILLLTSNGRIMLRERANTGYGDGAYEPPSGELADGETIVETAIRVASAAGIAIGAGNVSLAHVMHDVSASGRIAFFLSVSGWAGRSTPPDAGWFPLTDLPTNMLDRARVALRNYADGMRFSTYPAFALAGAGEADAFHVDGRTFRADAPLRADAPVGANGLFGTDGSKGTKELFGAGESHGANRVSGAKGLASQNAAAARREEARGVRLPG